MGPRTRRCQRARITVSGSTLAILGRAWTLWPFSLGFRLLLEGDYERGAALNEEAAALFRERGYKGGLELVLDNLGWAALLQGDPERARSYYRESLILCKEMANKMIASESLDGLACICVAEGATERATRLFGAAEALREAVGGQHTPEEAALREPGLATARSGLDEASWEEAWADRSPSLTRREKEVAILVGRGLTNRQIASEHFLSEHTVHHHVTNILKKLNLSSRQQVVSRLPDR